MAYAPTPLDTADVELPQSLVALRERLAKHVHEIWAQGRLKEGWRWGPERNDTLKTHPCLVTYETLPENEKDYDRNSADQTLKAILALGYSIVEPDVPDID